MSEDKELLQSHDKMLYVCNQLINYTHNGSWPFINVIQVLLKWLSNWIIITTSMWGAGCYYFCYLVNFSNITTQNELALKVISLSCTCGT